MAVVGWVDTEDVSLMDEWRDAPSDEDTLARYLGAAHEQCLAFLPQRRDAEGALQPVVPTPLPDRLQLAQIMQARALFNSVITGTDNRTGEPGMGVTVFPMDWTVKNLLRPARVGRVL